MVNFNFGFATYKSEILIHLSQWQYWWWFWFALLWSVYFFLIVRTMHKRVLHFNPILNTSLRGHGKWGDFLIALIPLSWCGNILVNSNFILRMIEWQNENSLFTLRVQGKQWYWVYKFDASISDGVYKRPINIGFGRWAMPAFNTVSPFFTSSISELSSQLEFQSMYLTLLEENQLHRAELEDRLYPVVSFSLGLKLVEGKKVESCGSEVVNTQHEAPFDDTSNFSANLIVNVGAKPLYIAKGLLNQHIQGILHEASSLPCNLFIVPQYIARESDLAVKPLQTEFFWGFRQKKYKRLKVFQFDRIILQDRGLRLLKQSMLENYKAVKYNRYRSELVPVTLARRLLRTKRTLVLPAHVNLTVITNSYDVVHSWFIPGLGLKLDCVPGRSTHHTFYIDNIGFYYGQCAEICGRYHHHMPIRFCALPLEQFIVWWEHRGFRRQLRLSVPTTTTTNS